MKSTWETRDLPVLEAIVELTDAGEDRLEQQQLADRTGLDRPSVRLALFALANEDPRLFDYTDTSTMAGRDIGIIRDPTGHARRRVGQWPTPEKWTAHFVQALADAEANEQDAEQKSKLRRVLDAIAGAGTDLVAKAVAETAARSMGL